MGREYPPILISNPRRRRREKGSHVHPLVESKVECPGLILLLQQKGDCTWDEEAAEFFKLVPQGRRGVLGKRAICSVSIPEYTYAHT